MTSTVRRSTRARPSDDYLLDAACAVFAERGFAGTTMNAIAVSAESTKPTLYAHFGDKDALYARLVQREADACRAWLFAAYDDNAELDIRAQVTGDMRAFFDYAAAERDGFRVLFGVGASVRSDAVREQLVIDIRAQVRRRITDYLTRTAPGLEIDTAHLARILVGIAMTSAEYVMDTHADADAACDLAAGFAVAALGG